MAKKGFQTCAHSTSSAFSDKQMDGLVCKAHGCEKVSHLVWLKCMAPKGVSEKGSRGKRQEPGHQEHHELNGECLGNEDLLRERMSDAGLGVTPCSCAGPAVHSHAENVLGIHPVGHKETSKALWPGSKQPHLCF